MIELAILIDVFGSVAVIAFAECYSRADKANKKLIFRLGLLGLIIIHTAVACLVN